MKNCFSRQSPKNCFSRQSPKQAQRVEKLCHRTGLPGFLEVGGFKVTCRQQI